MMPVLMLAVHAHAGPGSMVSGTVVWSPESLRQYYSALHKHAGDWVKVSLLATGMGGRSRKLGLVG